MPPFVARLDRFIRWFVNVSPAASASTTARLEGAGPLTLAGAKVKP